MLLVRRDPKCDILLYRRMFGLVHADSSTRDDIDQFWPVVAMEIGATVWWKDGMAERELLNPFLVWSEDHFNVTPIGGRNLDPRFFPSLNPVSYTHLDVYKRQTLEQ